MPRWNPWHGCHKISDGCRHCYVYRTDAYHGKDSSVVTQTKEFNLPVRLNRKKTYKLTGPAPVFTCFTSDFFLPEADQWRKAAWEMIRLRSDLKFFMITKRIDRFNVSLPTDWGDGYDNVCVACTVENQDRANYRLPIYKDAPIKEKIIVCAPLLEPLDLTQHLGPWVNQVSVGGEAGKYARACHYDWVLNIRRQCMDRQISFHFHQTGSKLIKDGKLYLIPKNLQYTQARKAQINFP